jgi:hypothetical protein
VPAVFEQNLLRMMQHPTTVQRFASEFSTNYDTNLAQTAIPTPITVGRRFLLEKALIAAFAPPGAGNPVKAASGIVQGLTVFWPGVPVPGGVVTAFLGGPVLFSSLVLGFVNPKVSNELAAKQLALSLAAATQLVQYVIPPAPPAFLVVPP